MWFSPYTYWWSFPFCLDNVPAFLCLNVSISLPTNVHLSVHPTVSVHLFIYLHLWSTGLVIFAFPRSIFFSSAHSLSYLTVPPPIPHMLQVTTPPSLCLIIFFTRVTRDSSLQPSPIYSTFPVSCLAIDLDPNASICPHHRCCHLRHKQRQGGIKEGAEGEHGIRPVEILAAQTTKHREASSTIAR